MIITILVIIIPMNLISNKKIKIKIQITPLADISTKDMCSANGTKIFSKIKTSLIHMRKTRKIENSKRLKILKKHKKSKLSNQKSKKLMKKKKNKRVSSRLEKSLIKMRKSFAQTIGSNCAKFYKKQKHS
jgi:hypothetical protein